MILLRKSLVDTIKRHEGLRLKPYLCTAGKLTIGYGRNLETNGISGDEAEYLLKNDIERATWACYERIPFFSDAPFQVQDVLVNMCFQLGINGLLAFKKTLKLLEEKKYSEASKEMLNSNWAKQTPNRAKELYEIIRNVKP